MTMQIDVAIPTYGGESTIEDCLTHLVEAIQPSQFQINRLLIDWKPADNLDSTGRNVSDFCMNRNISHVIHKNDHNLPESRQFLIEQIQTEWFLFLDDDVLLSPDAMTAGYAAISPAVGGIQSRRATDTHTPAEWSRWRPVRGTLFASLIRMQALEDIEIPSDITVLEDEYIREHIDNEGYLWLFDHQFQFLHKSQHRHEIDFNEGRIAGKYGLLPIWYVFGNVAYNPVDPKHYKRAIGYVKGRWL